MKTRCKMPIYMPIVIWFMRSGNSLGMLTQCGIRRWIEITLSSQLPRTTEILLAKPRVCTVSISAAKTDKTGSDSRNSRVLSSFENHQRAKMKCKDAKFFLTNSFIIVSRRSKEFEKDITEILNMYYK